MRVGSRKDQPLVTVTPLHDVRRSPVCTAHLYYSALLAMDIGSPAFYDQLVAHLCSHAPNSLRAEAGHKR